MREQPRFGIENSLPLALVVLRRIVRDGEKFGQRRERFMCKQLQVMANRLGDERAVTGRFKRGI